MTTATNTISVALAANPGGATLGGTLSISASGGVATFSNLTINKVANGYTLKLSSAGFGPRDYDGHRRDQERQRHGCRRSAGCKRTQRPDGAAAVRRYRIPSEPEESEGASVDLIGLPSGTRRVVNKKPFAVPRLDRRVENHVRPHFVPILIVQIL